METTTTHDDVKKYYGESLQSSKDLKTGICCSMEAMPIHSREALKNVHHEVLDRFYGCGSPIPPLVKDAQVLDLGCGTGRDCYILSQLVGPNGFVTGVDMTQEQLQVAEKYIPWHMEKFQYSKPNVAFKHAYIEDLKAADIADNSMDLVVSNCVVNLSPNKEKVLAEIFRVLKPGGELYFSDIFTNRRVPEELKKDPVLRGECLSGALYIEDFRRLLRNNNCLDYRTVNTALAPLMDPKIIAKLGMIDFYSLTIRAFKCNFEDVCEDYGQVAWYKGTIPSNPHSFVLDDHHEFKTNQPMLVCGNTAKMISETRYGKHFRVEGNTDTHYGAFDCAPLGSSEKHSNEKSSTTTSSCC